MLGKNDVTILYFCFALYIYLPEKYRSQQLIDEMIEKLQNVNYYYVDLVLGKYYFKSKVKRNILILLYTIFIILLF